MKTIIVAFVLLVLFSSQQIEAKDCPRMCTMEYAPVCGSNGVTYGNACMLRAASCRSDGKITLVHKGECCPKICTANWAPVCGSDGVTYGNECMLRGASCGSDGKITMVHKGVC